MGTRIYRKIWKYLFYNYNDFNKFMKRDILEKHNFIEIRTK